MAQSTGTMAFTAGQSSTKSSPGSPFSGFGFGSTPRTSSNRVFVRPPGVVLSTMGSIPGNINGLASESALELDNLGALDIAKNPDLEEGYPEVDIGLASAVSGIRVDVEKTTM